MADDSDRSYEEGLWDCGHVWLLHGAALTIQVNQHYATTTATTTTTAAAAASSMLFYTHGDRTDY